ncbi:hypothetical protein Acr_07g0003620 [Actinidia rufa]|uniref:Uncharacterized protein n=1 Tax=Actinidia rufa TaxID=165716 RepID=A0A7J0EUI8_9ERIC|nr:hypothetical protein Acr_07g0003620 [Actinidia rufa]
MELLVGGPRAPRPSPKNFSSLGISRIYFPELPSKDVSKEPKAPPLEESPQRYSISARGSSPRAPLQTSSSVRVKEPPWHFLARKNNGIMSVA